MAKAWSERINKENRQAEQFWAMQALQAGGQQGGSSSSYSQAPAGYSASVVTSAVPSGFSSKSSFLRDRLDRLERELQQEKEYRLKVEEELAMLKTASRPSSKPGTPRY